MTKHLYKYKNDPTETHELHFDSSDLFECLVHGIETNEFSHLENAIAIRNSKRGYALKNINELIEQYQLTDNVHLTKKLKTIKTYLL